MPYGLFESEAGGLTIVVTTGVSNVELDALAFLTTIISCHLQSSIMEFNAHFELHSQLIWNGCGNDQNVIHAINAGFNNWHGPGC